MSYNVVMFEQKTESEQAASVEGRLAAARLSASQRLQAHKQQAMQTQLRHAQAQARFNNNSKGVVHSRQQLVTRTGRDMEPKVSAILN